MITDIFILDSDYNLVVVTVTCNHNTLKNLYSIKSYHATSIEQLNSSSQIDLQNIVVNIGVACAQREVVGIFKTTRILVKATDHDQLAKFVHG